MKLVEAFSVGVIEETMLNTWSAIGRAYEDIKIGEELVCFTNERQRLSFIVKQIMIYRKIISELNSGLTGELILMGDESFIGLETVSMLYREQ
ncbi:hypothetical protein B5M42_015255 [Paenibacillus athensensis]|uniref:Uncharacterized protein n=1 Tax=Paenibacillus athensensis TaxID=1967502 RepID=A0A4Y8PSI9_9BACL|nr:hypothetical protein [Paenibacillus athensensis]MCD1260170.1 hypothetical protein [Paenibacillus athensensis]